MRSIAVNIGLLICVLGCDPGTYSGTTHCSSNCVTESEAELIDLQILIPGFEIVALPAGSDDLQLTLLQSYTIEDLRGKVLDSDPPVLGTAPTYSARHDDGFAAGEGPYVAADIAPFRLHAFNNEFNYGGWHNYPMTDYALAHGFSIASPYVRSVDEGAHVPAGSQWLKWGGFVNWKTWMPAHGVAEDRFDLLVDLDVVALLTQEGIFTRDLASTALGAHADQLMIDIEHSVLPPDTLRLQAFYPASGTETEKAEFEANYYQGYGMTYTAPVQTARASGWWNLSIYGWYPFGRTWGGLEQVEADPGSDFAWNAFGQSIFNEIDIVNNSVYCFYWTTSNVAYTLANIDTNVLMTGNAKPIRPYYWTLLHGGGGGWRWWKEQPVANEEQRAMTAMAFFTGIDGFDTWNWSGTGNHHEPRAIEVDADLMLGESFVADGTPFDRYDVLHITSVDTPSGAVTFQPIQSGAINYGVDGSYPIYNTTVAELAPKLRPLSDPVGAMIEGMALIKPIERSVRNGEVMIDVPSQQQFGERLPIVRRVRLNGVHILVTYDPNIIYGSQPVGETSPPLAGETRDITIDDFDGVVGRTLTLPADEKVRIFILRE